MKSAAPRTTSLRWTNVTDHALHFRTIFHLTFRAPNPSGRLDLADSKLPLRGMARLDWRLLRRCASLTRRSEFQRHRVGVENLQDQFGTIPYNRQGLKVLVEQPPIDPKPKRWVQIFRRLPRDPWGNEYQYCAPAVKNPENFELWSYGKDGRPRTSDDVDSLKAVTTKQAQDSPAP
jgi:type II secretion system protein G